MLEYSIHGYDSMPLERTAVDLVRRYETGVQFRVEETLLDGLVRSGGARALARQVVGASVSTNW
jgi:hypothetical protein